MKITINTEQEKKFNPIDISFKIESLQELEIFVALLNGGGNLYVSLRRNFPLRLGAPTFSLGQFSQFIGDLEPYKKLVDLYNERK